MLDILNISKTFNAGTINEKHALTNLSLRLEDNDFVTVIGGNGAGKSTLLNAIAGVWPLDSGKILLDGENITRLPEHKRAKNIGRVFQDPMMGTAPDMQLEENLALAMRRGQRRGLRWEITGDEREFYYVKLKELGLGEKTEPVIVIKGMDIITGGVFNYPLRIYGGILEFLSFFTQLFASKIFDLIKPAPPLPLSII